MVLRVCQLCAVDFTVRKFLITLIDSMLEKEWLVRVVCTHGDDIPNLKKEGYAIDCITISRSMNPFHALKSFVRLVQYFHKHKFDVLHAHTPVAAFIGRIAAKLCGIPMVVYTAHGFYFHENMPLLKRLFFVSLEWIGGKFTDLLFCQSEEDAIEAVLYGILPPEKVLIIGNGVNTVKFSPKGSQESQLIRSCLGLPDNAYVAGLIGRQVREKGVGDFLEAMILLAERHADLRVLLVGERLSSDHSDGIEKELRQAIEKLADRIIILGARDDIPSLLAAMDVFCLPSWREGMPRTIIEAMMMAKPVVTTNIRGAREEVIDNVTGLIVPVRSPILLSNAIERLINDRHLGKVMGNAGRKRALKLYDENVIVDRQIRKISEEFVKCRIGRRNVVSDHASSRRSSSN